MKEIINYIAESEWAKGISFAVFGGFVRIYIQHKGRLKLRTVFSGVLAASFIGVVLIELVKYYDINRRIIGVMTILSGFCHTEMINIITERFLKLIKKENDDDKKL